MYVKISNIYCKISYLNIFVFELLQQKPKFIWKDIVINDNYDNLSYTGKYPI